MAKVMISLPDDLLRRLDARARERRTTRSGLLKDLAERELQATDRRRADEIAALLGAAGRYGGSGAEDVRRLRRSR